MYSFPKSVRLRSRRQFQRVAQQPTRLVGPCLVIEYRLSKYPEIRMGITVSRHYGKAVDRNRFKRILREAFRLCLPQLATICPTGFDMNIKPRESAHRATSLDIQSELLKLLAPKVT